MTATRLGKMACRVALFWCLLLISGATQALQAEATLEPSAFPQAVVADGSSVVNLTVTVRDKNGQVVPDGTQVLFESTLGTITRPAVGTVNGLAQTQLIAGRIVGEAKVTMSVLTFRATGLITVPFVKDRKELETQGEFVEIFTPGKLIYSTELRIFQVDGPGKRAILRFRNIEVRGDDLQYDLRTYQLKGRRVSLKIGDEQRQFEQLDFNFKSLKGVGVADIPSKRVVVEGRPPYFRVGVIEGMKRAIVEVNRLEVTARTQPTDPTQFDFHELIDVTTLIYAKRAVAFPQREVQFQNAAVDVAGTIVMRVPLFRVSTLSVRPVITEEFVQVGSNQLAINVPYYLALKSGSDSLLRIRYGSMFARGVGASGGMFLDLEHNWRDNDQVMGNFTIRGISRKDWSLSARQSITLDSKSRAYVQADFPGHRVLSGSLFADRRLPGGRFHYVASGNRSVRGEKSNDLDQSFGLNSDPRSLGKLPFSYSVGVANTVRNSDSSFLKLYQRTNAAELNLTMAPVMMKQSSLSLSARISRVQGRIIQSPTGGTTTSTKLDRLTTNVSLGYVAAPSNSLSVVTGYEFSDDPFNASLIGSHRLYANVTVRSGALSLAAFGTKSIGFNRHSLQGDAWYRFAPLWRLGVSHTLDAFQNGKYADTSVVVGYQLGYRQIGLSWSQRKQRIGIEILGVPFD